MGKRGRTSAAALAVENIKENNVISVGGDRRPRVEMTEREMHYWRTVMDSPAGEYIHPESHPLLYEYCRLAASCDRFAEMIREVESGDEPMSGRVLKDYDQLLKMRERAGKAASEISVKLRIAPSSRVHKEKAGTLAGRPRGSRPWEE